MQCRKTAFGQEAYHLKLVLWLWYRLARVAGILGTLSPSSSTIYATIRTMLLMRESQSMKLRHADLHKLFYYCSTIFAVQGVKPEPE